MIRILVLFVALALTLPMIPVWGKTQAHFIVSIPQHQFEPGEIIHAHVSIDPAGYTVDTARLFLSYPTDTVEVVSVQLETPFASAPENAVDAAKGLIRWGGFTTTGIKKTTPFATIALRATQPGDVMLQVEKSSLILSAGKNYIDSSMEVVSTATISSKTTTANRLTLVCPTHPDQTKWYKTTTVQCEWTHADNLPVLLDISRDASVVPRTKQTEHTVVFGPLEEGVWYARARAEDGSNGVATHVIHIDTTAPREIVPILEVTGAEGDKVYINSQFGTVDDLSGVEHYELKIGTAPLTVVQSPYHIVAPNTPGLPLVFRAYDHAGNFSDHSTTVPSYIQTPVPESQDSAKMNMQSYIEDNKPQLMGAGLAALAAIAIALWLRSRKTRVNKSF